MFTAWFGSRRHRRQRELEQRIESLEQTIRALTEQGLGNQVTIDQLHVHHPVLENLNFHLDSLDIHELSGALNLGNNFGIRVNQRPVRPRRPGQTPSPDSQVDEQGSDTSEEGQTDDHRSSQFETTDSGFRIRFRSSPP